MRRFFDGGFFAGGFFGASTDAGSGMYQWTQADIDAYVNGMTPKKKPKHKEKFEYGTYLDRYWTNR